MPRVLLISTTTGYQTRAFGEAAARLGVELVFATDRCHVLDDPWRDDAIPIRFSDEKGAVDAITTSAAERPIDGVLGLGDRAAVIAALAADALGLAGHPPEAARAASNKRLTRERLRGAGLPCPWFHVVAMDARDDELGVVREFPCVVKPLALSASRGVMRADTPAELAQATSRLRRLLAASEIRAERDPAHAHILIEGFVPGTEFALEGVMENGRLATLAIFDKPDPLDGPFFEETIYVTPSALPPADERQLEDVIGRAAEALGLVWGPVHAEARVNAAGVFVLEVAARPIGGLCSRSLRFGCPGAAACTLEEVLLRHTLGESVGRCRREAQASAVMMVPISVAGLYRTVEGVDEALRVPGVDEIVVTAKVGQRLRPLPDGASYLGFIFARAGSAAEAVAAIRAAHARLRVVLDPMIEVNVT